MSTLKVHNIEPATGTDVALGAAGDTITIKIPNNGTAAAGNNAQGAVIRTAAHNITTDGPLQVEADIMFRNLQIEIADKQYYYP